MFSNAYLLSWQDWLKDVPDTKIFINQNDTITIVSIQKAMASSFVASKFIKKEETDGK